tara:strand:+ start:2682 stop:4979 length:2298 start_codon:yes stop_codon:yes gene_type:complete
MLKLSKLTFIVKLIFFIFFFTEKSYSFCTLDTIKLNSIENISNLEIKINNERSYLKNISKKLLDIEMRKKFSKNRKNFKANIIINYNNGSKCETNAIIRSHGDYADHIDLINGIPTSSIRVKLIEGNISGITRFILLRPKSRYSDNEVFISTLLSHLNFLSPRTSYLDTIIHNNKTKFIFQEHLKKEFLEFNNKLEGPIVEKNEDFSNPKILLLARISNFEWIKKDNFKLLKSFESLRRYNDILIRSYKNTISSGGYLEINKNFLSKKEYEKLSTYDSLILAMDAIHALSIEDRRFYFDPTYLAIEPIYYDGMSNILSTVGYNYVDEKYNKYLPSGLRLRSINEKDITNSSISGANNALKLINSLDKEKLYTELKIRGLEKIKIDDLENILKTIKERLFFLKNYQIKKTNHFETKRINLYQKFKENMGLVENTKLVFLKKSFKMFNYASNDIEICSIDLKNCQIKTIERKKLKKMLEQEFSFNKKNNPNNYLIHLLMSKKEFFELELNNKKNYLDKNFQKIVLDNNTKIYFSDKVEIINNQNEIIVNFFDNNERVVVFDSELRNISIKMNNLSKNTEKIIQNNFGITGCLTIVDSFLDNVSIEASNFNCEDTVNLIRSKGKLDKIKIDNSFSDALDIDFSEINITNLTINNSLNDCSDFSFGKYKITNIQTTNCGDKAISVGENSEMKIANFKVSETILGLASKDNSKTYIKKFDGNNLNECVAVYKKKQEFDGGYLNIEEFNCKNYKNKISKDDLSTVIIKNDI